MTTTYQSKNFTLTGIMKDLNEFNQVKLQIDLPQYQKLQTLAKPGFSDNSGLDDEENAENALSTTSQYKVPFFITNFIDDDGRDASNYYVHIKIPKWLRANNIKYYSKKNQKVTVKCMSLEYNFTNRDTEENKEGCTLNLISI